MNDLNGLVVCVNAVMVNGEWFEWLTCMGEWCSGKWVTGRRGMIWMAHMYVWML